MRDFMRIFLRFLSGWIIAFLVLCVIALIRYKDILFMNLGGELNGLVEGGVTIFMTIFVIVMLIRSVFPH